RLEDLARTMDQEKLDKQRDIVRNERRQSYENRPYGKAELQIEEMMYPPGHPYHIPTIGTHEDLEAATLPDVKNFFATFYLPRNATLVVAGDFDSKVIKPLVAQLFGTLPGGVEPPHAKPQLVKLDREYRAVTVDKVQLPMVAMCYHSPAQFAEGDAEMDLAAAVLSEGKTSRLYKRLVYDDKIATSVHAYQDSGMLGSTFRVDVLVPAGTDLVKVEKTVDEELAKFVADGPTKAELEQHKATMELNMLRSLQSVERKADRLNEYDFFWNEPNSFKRDLDRYRNATVEAVTKWSKQVITPGARVVMRVMPEAPERDQTPRDKEPDSLATRPFTPPKPETFKLAGGIPVMLWQKSELPMVAMEVIFKTGGVLGEIPKAGAVSLAANMLDEGAGELDALKFGDAMQSLGAEFGTGADQDSLSVNLVVLKRNFEKAAGLAADSLRKPRFDQKEWDRVKRLHLESLKQQEEQPNIVAARVAARVFFGDSHPYAWPSSGTTDSVTKLTLDDVKEQYRSIVRPELATILVAGDISQGEVQQTLDKLFGDWKQEGKAAAKVEPTPPKGEPLRTILVNRPDAVQTVVYFMMPGVKFADDNRVKYELLNTMLGGSFTSRLNLNLREEHGYTYGARSDFAMHPAIGYAIARSSVRADVTGESVAEFLGEFARIRSGDITEDETLKAREQLRTEVVHSFEGLSGILAEASQRLIGGVPFETLASDMTAMQSVSAGELNKLAKPALPYDNGVVILVGNKKTVLEEIKDILPTPVELNVRGDRVQPTPAQESKKESPGL
ncbi:MAG: insulinase family protein, partial [Planctomycetes bacterium]|nr:insulinase family protein [Planctomycetota bacterium]